MTFVDAHAITPAVSKTFTWSGAAEAYEALRRADHFGKVVIDIQDHS
jgi:D-arabinose 1-dehydrogenase-like Zn-dependent alcohol dehydrogenase